MEYPFDVVLTPEHHARVVEKGHEIGDIVDQLEALQIKFREKNEELWDLVNEDPNVDTEAYQYSYLREEDKIVCKGPMPEDDGFLNFLRSMGVDPNED